MYLAAEYAVPVMLMALLLGMAMNFVYAEQRFCPGINFATSSILRAGVALLGLRITLEQVVLIGPANLAILATAVALTIGAGAVLATRLGKSMEFGILTGGSVSICGASAAIAIGTVLPPHPEREKQVVFTVLCVTTLSTIAMILYPQISNELGFTAEQAGLLLGGTIHDVAQVVGAGYSVSVEAGDFATIAKLFRVLMLLPVFLVIGFLFRARTSAGQHGDFPVPWFIGGFIACMLLATFDVLPAAVANAGLDLSKFCLVVAIAALGMKTNLRVLFKGSAAALGLVVAETLILFGIILGWLVFSG
jgi:uncharacterized integral membrane protein (TIGR00698 family)